MGAVGGTVSIFLSTGQQDITIIDRPGTIALSGAPGGDDIVRFAGAADTYTVTRSGSRVIISDGDTSVAIAVSGSPINLVFSDGTRSLRADDNTVLIGDQVVVTTPAAISAAPDVAGVAAAGTTAVRGQLILAEGDPVVVAGPFDVFGTTAGAEAFTALSGDIAVRSGFAGGLDTIVFEASASTFTATRSASQVIIEGPGLRISIPVSTAGVMLNFAGDTRSLRFDSEAGQIVIGDQVIGNAPITLSATGAVSLIELGDLTPSQGFAIEGSEEGDRAGRSVSSAGDLNGDGFDDIVVGVTGANGQAGETYVLFGSAVPFPARTVGEDLNGANGFRILGENPFGESGFSVSRAGDVNGDGLADLVIGAPNTSTGGAEASYVIFGSTQGFGPTLALADLDGTNGFRIDGALPGGEAGFSVANAGDVDGDGIDDLIIGAHRSAASGNDLAGSSYIMFGSAQGFGASLDLATPGASRVTRIDGAGPDELSGLSVAGAGDVNGDGIDDVVIGAPGAGAAYVVFGSAGGLPPVVNLAALNGTNGFRLAGATDTNDEGFSVAGIGDINGDGIDDLAIGAPSTTAGGAAAGATFVVFGSTTPFAASLDLAALGLTAGFVISGSGAGDQAGFAVAGAGDVNGDGYDDLIIGARLNDGNGINAGEAYVVFGRPGGFATNLNIFDLDGSNGFRIRGASAGDEAGFSVASAGDVNGDGFDDLIIGGAGTGGAGGGSGSAFVIYGGATGTENTATVSRTGTAGGDNLIGNGGDDVLVGAGGADVIRGGAGNDRISIADLAFADIDGGRGTDTLALGGAGLTLDLTSSISRRLDSIEVIDLTGSGNNRLIVSERAITNLTEERSGGDARLIVTGNAGDIVEAQGFVASAAQPIGALSRTTGPLANATQTIDGITYNVFVSGNSVLLAQQGVTVITNRAPVIESAAAFTIGENQRDAFGAQASDADGDALTYSLSGPDAALFSINPANGFVAFLTAPDFEAPGDANFDNRYQITVTVSDGRESASQAVTVTVADVNEAPAFASGNTFAVAENQTAAFAANADDPDGNALTYSLSGADAALFAVDAATGVVTFLTAPNFELPGDADGDNRYQITVTASDGSLSTDQAVTITVTDVNEAPTAVALNNQLASRAENSPSTFAVKVADIAVTDDALGVVTITLTGADAAFFEVVNGELRLRAGVALDFETKSTYDVTVNVADLTIPGSAPVSTNYTLTVTDVNEAPTAVALNNQLASRAENSPSGAAIKVADIAITDDALGTNTVTLSGADAAAFEVVGSELQLRAGVALDFETKSTYDVTVNVVDPTIPGSAPLTANYTLAVTDVNEAPTVTSGATATVDENQTAAYTATATDPDAGTTLTFSISGTDAALFDIDSTTGVVTFKAAPNFEAPADSGGNNQYNFTVRATDGGGLFDDQAVTITVANVNEAPTVTSGATATVDENQTAAYTATATDPDAGTVLTFSLSGTDAALFDIDSATGVVTFKAAPDFEAPADDDGDNDYEITVRATDAGGLFDDQAVTITVADVQEQLIFDLTTLTAAQGFIIQGDAEGDQAGSSVSSAGDINGDGFDDLIIGADRGDDGGTDAGEAYVVFGSASGFGSPVAIDGVIRQVIDLTTLTAAQGFIIQGDAANDFAGFSLSRAGDLNGDGFDDLIVGARAGDDGGYAAGEAYVVFGSANGFGSPVTIDGVTRQVIDLTTLSAAQGFIIQGDAASDNAGISVSSAGDVNGDGFDDVIVGARYGGDGGIRTGEAYVVFGSANGFGSPVNTDGVIRQVIDLTTLTAAQGFVILGDAEGDQTGISVSSAGDVNGDGFDDLIVGARAGDDGGDAAGEAYVIFGSANGFGSPVTIDGVTRQVTDLTTLTATQGFIIQGDEVRDQAGFSVSSAGDVNGDGFDDLVVGALAGDDGGPAAGEAYVVFGRANGFGSPVTTDGVTRQVIDLTTLTAAQGFIIQGDAEGDQAGLSISSAGDVNGDGFDDLIVGAPGGDDGGIQAGEAYVVLGGASGFGLPVTIDGATRQVIDLTAFTAAQGFIIPGDATGDGVGRSVSSAGDVNGDGFDDLIVGATGGDDGGGFAGEAYVIFGGATGTEDLTPVTRTGTASADNFTGNAGNDTFTGIGAGDVVRGGAGDDSIAITSTAFADIRGGRGNDTLALAGSGLSLDLTTTPRPRLDSIEVIDLTGTGNNSLTVSELAIYRITEQRSGGEATLIVEGNAGDSVDAQDFIVSGTQMLGGVTYNLFEKGNANLLVAQGVTVTGANNRPVATDDSGTANEDAPLVVTAASTTLGAAGLLTNDTDLDSNPLSITAVNGVAGNVGTQFALASGALLTVNADGSYTYDPNDQFEALRPGETDTDSFTYTLSDGSLTDTATVTITITGVNDAPTVANPIADQAFDEDTAVNFTVPANTFADVDNATLTYSAALAGGGALPSWLNFNATTRTFSGTPTPLNFNGAIDVQVTASDGALSVSDVFTLTITPVNDAPDAVNDVATTDEDTAVTVPVASGLLANDTDVDAGTTLSITQINGAPVTFGTPIAVAGGGTVTVSADGSYVFNPNGAYEALRPGQNDTASFTYTISDGALTDTATATITIEGRNERPIAGNDTLSMTGNTPITITAASLLVNDSDPDGTPTTAITLTAVGGATNGTVTLSGGSITFTPTTGYTGTASFTYTIQDVDGATATGTVNVTVNGLVWYVDNSYAGANGTADGSFARPFTSLTPLNGVTGDGTTNDDVDGAGNTIFVARTATAYTGGITLEAGQKLFGDGHEFEVNGIQIGSGVTTNPIINHGLSGIRLSTDNEIRGLTISGTTTFAIGIQDGNGTVGNLTIAGVSVTGLGKAVDIDQGGNLAVSLDELSSNLSDNEGVHLQGVTGSFVATTGTIQGANKQGFLIGAAGGGLANSGGNATITYGGSLTNNGVQNEANVEIQDRTGGVVTYSGSINTTVGLGIVADGNAGTINFGGEIQINSGPRFAILLANNSAAINFTPTGAGLDITTTTGNGFIVDGGGGTVTLSGAGNTVTTTSGRAVEIDGVTIGTGGVNFESVTINNGTTSTGIFLRNAGSGGFNITGTGTTAGSGGTINSIDGGADGSIEQGIGVYIENTNNISLSNMAFTGDFANFGIRGNTVNGFTLRNSTFNAAASDDGGFGNSSVADEGVIRFNGLTGTALFEGNNISDGHEDVLRIDNSAGTLNLTVRGLGTIGAVIGRNGTGIDGSGNLIPGTATGNDGIIVNGSGTSNITVLIDGVQFTGSRGDMIQTEASGNATQNITIRNSTFANLHPDVVSGGGGVTIGLSGGTGAGPGVTYNVANNTFTGAEGTVLLVGAIGPSGAMTGTILNNVIGTPGGGYNGDQATTGSNNSGFGIALLLEKLPGGGSLTSAVRIEGNTIRDVDGDGIFLRSNGAGDGTTARLEATIRNNTIAELGDAAFAGIYAQVGGSGGADDGLLGLDISNNTINMNGATTAGAAVFFDDLANNSQFYLPGFVGAVTDGSIESFLTGAKGNTLIVGSGVSGFASSSTGTFLTGAALALPPPLMVELGTAPTGGGVEATLSAVEALHEAAIQLWIDAGASDAQIAAMRAITLSVGDLYGGFLGQTTADGIVIDSDAAGYGWFIDATPLTNEEFMLGANGLTARAGSEAAQGIDLLTAIAHELGHVLGLDDLYGDAEGVMDAFLAPGERNLPEAMTAPAVGGGSDAEQVAIGGLDSDMLLPGMSAAGSSTMLLAEVVSTPVWDAIGMMPQIVPVDASVL